MEDCSDEAMECCERSNTPTLQHSTLQHPSASARSGTVTKPFVTLSTTESRDLRKGKLLRACGIGVAHAPLTSRTRNTDSGQNSGCSAAVDQPKLTNETSRNYTRDYHVPRHHRPLISDSRHFLCKGKCASRDGRDDRTRSRGVRSQQQRRDFLARRPKSNWEQRRVTDSPGADDIG